RKDVHFIENAIAYYGITNTYISPGMLKVYRNRSKTLKTVKTVGERLCNQFSSEYKIINIYGASETLLALAFEVDKNYENTPIGKPVNGISVYILNEKGEPVKDGEEGEICVAGAISDGYLNLPEQTAKVYLPNPFSTCDDDKILFHTNDIAKRLDDGNIVYVNRKDWMVKINGQRVEVGEIEICSQKVIGVERAVVKAFENDYGQTYLVEYFKGDGVTSEDIKKHLHTVLPEYMIPLFFVKVEEFPLNANGKINRLALEKPVASMFKTEYIAPANALQKLLCEKFEEILECGRVGIKDSFFDLGGDSIRVLKLQNICNMPKLSTKIIYDGKTPEKIAELIENAEEKITYDILSDYPITKTQYGIFVDCEENRTTTIYNLPSLFKLSDTVDIKRLKKAVENTINAHPYIKTRLFLNDDGDVRAGRNDEDKAEIEITECSSLPDASELVIPFEILGGNLYRASIYITDNGNYLFLDLHHIISDGTSFSVIIEDINNAYDGKEVDTESYTGFEAALDEEKARKTEAYTKAKEYYDSIFSGCDTDFLPIKDKNDSTPSVGNCEFISDLPVESVKKFCADNNITLNAFFNGVFGFVLSKYNNKDEALFTTVYNGRNDSRLARAVTMLVKTFPVLCKTNGDRKIIDLLTDTKNQLMQSMSNDIYSFAEISREYNINADILFVYQGDSFEFDTIGGEKAESIAMSLDTAKAPITINVFLENNKFVFKCEYRSDMYEQSTMLRMAECLSVVSDEFMNKTYLNEVTLLSAESEKLLDSFNNTERAYEKTDIVTLFRRQAEQNPDNTAVVYLDKSYTYKEVDEISERIGGYISSLGIGREDVVSILIPRCEYMVIASLGALKSGAAYQPLDPSYPQERLEFMM
ncbi:MAG: condensation domain-containing protein, partial [Eubacterium sp.]